MLLIPIRACAVSFFCGGESIARVKYCGVMDAAGRVTARGRAGHAPHRRCQSSAPGHGKVASNSPWGPGAPYGDTYDFFAHLYHLVSRWINPGSSSAGNGTPGRWEPRAGSSLVWVLELSQRKLKGRSTCKERAMA